VGILLLTSFVWLIINNKDTYTDQKVFESHPSPQPSIATVTSKSCQVKMKVPIPENEHHGVLWICEDKLVLDYPPTNWDVLVSQGDTVLDSADAFFSLFFIDYKKTGKERIPQFINIKETSQGTAILVKANLAYGSATHKGAAVYLVLKDRAFKVYQEDQNTPGNASFISIYQTEPLVIKEVSNLAPLGPNSARPTWVDLYGWDSKLQKQILVNNLHPEVFKELTEEYTMYDQKSCEETGQLLTEAYRERNTQEKVCGETDQSPYVTSKYTKIFLQARETAIRILQGENLSHQDIEKIELGRKLLSLSREENHL
jgi:hypothetical protein